MSDDKEASVPFGLGMIMAAPIGSTRYDPGNGAETVKARIAVSLTRAQAARAARSLLDFLAQEDGHPEDEEWLRLEGEVWLGLFGGDDDCCEWEQDCGAMIVRRVAQLATLGPEDEEPEATVARIFGDAAKPPGDTPR